MCLYEKKEEAWRLLLRTANSAEMVHQVGMQICEAREIAQVLEIVRHLELEHPARALDHDDERGIQDHRPDRINVIGSDARRQV